jgi:cytochrome oxidase Cu insertion factor (SCO1/SenC/PrrC family)
VEPRNRRQKRDRFAHPRVSVYRQTEGGTISHGLASALINRDGTIVKIWRGNGWTPAEVIQAIQAESK